MSYVLSSSLKAFSDFHVGSLRSSPNSSFLLLLLPSSEAAIQLKADPMPPSTHVQKQAVSGPASKDAESGFDRDHRASELNPGALGLTFDSHIWGPRRDSKLGRASRPHSGIS
jgi:hypothetical protein